MNKYLNQISQKTKLFFMRHAETEHNNKHLITGNQKTRLSENGIAQAVQTASFFAEIPINVVLHSSLPRTQHTGEIIIEELKKQKHIEQSIPFQKCSELVEMGAGIWTHKSLKDIAVEDPELYSLFKRHSWEAVPESEKIVSLVDRCDKVWSVILDLSNKGYSNILVISHGGFLNWLLKTSLSLSGDHLSSWSPIVRTNNCGIHELYIDVHESHPFGTWKQINHTCYN